MNKLLPILIVFSQLAGYTLAAQQMHPYFTVDQLHEHMQLDFHLSTKSGDCYVKKNQSGVEPVLILGNTENDAATSSFWSETKGNNKQVKVDLRNKHENTSFTNLLSKSFGASEPIKNQWHVFLSPYHPLNLQFNYAFGNAYLDLSGLHVGKVKVNTASANVHLGFDEQMHNPIMMDTFMVNVEFGSIQLKDLHFANVKDVIAYVGFGSMSIDFENDWQRDCQIKASVAAGSLDIYLPSSELPIMIKVNESPLCSVKMLDDMIKISNNTFVNAAFQANKAYPLVFNLDVGMGSITFHQK